MQGQTQSAGWVRSARRKRNRNGESEPASLANTVTPDVCVPPHTILVVNSTTFHQARQHRSSHLHFLLNALYHQPPLFGRVCVPDDNDSRLASLTHNRGQKLAQCRTPFLSHLAAAFCERLNSRHWRSPPWYRRAGVDGLDHCSRLSHVLYFRQRPANGRPEGVKGWPGSNGRTVAGSAAAANAGSGPGTGVSRAAEGNG